MQTRVGVANATRAAGMSAAGMTMPPMHHACMLQQMRGLAHAMRWRTCTCSAAAGPSLPEPSKAPKASAVRNARTRKLGTAAPAPPPTPSPSRCPAPATVFPPPAFQSSSQQRRQTSSSPGSPSSSPSPTPRAASAAAPRQQPRSSGSGSGASSSSQAGSGGGRAAPAGSPAAIRAYISALNQEQMAAVTATSHTVRVKAGPGSGKTRVVTARVAHLLQQGAPPSSLMVITFTNKAARELKERLGGVLGWEKAKAITAGTFHSIAHRLLRAHVGSLPGAGLTPGFTILDDDDSEGAMQAALESLGAYRNMEGRALAKAAGVFKEVVSIVKNRMATTHGVSVAATIRDALAAKALPLPVNVPGVNPALVQKPEHLELVFGTYVKRVRDANGADFDDLLGLAVALLQRVPEVRERLRGQYAHILVDEFQDTNTPQYELVKLLKGERGHLFVVGDPDQAIYSWRGADPTNMDTSLTRDFPGTATAFLSNNYRSGSAILATAEAVLSHGGLPALHQRLVAANGHTGHVEHVCLANEAAEAGWVAAKAEALHRDGLPYTDMAVVYRTNLQARVIEDRLSARGIPYRVLGQISLWKRKEVKDVQAFLRLAANTSDATALARVINLPARGLGDKAVEKVNELAAARGVSPATLLLGDCGQVWLGLAGTQRALAKATEGAQGGKKDPAPCVLADLQLAPDISGVLGAGVLPKTAVRGVNELRALVVLLRNVARYLPLPETVRVIEEGARYAGVVGGKDGLGYIRQLKGYMAHRNTWYTKLEDSLEDMLHGAPAVQPTSATITAVPAPGAAATPAKGRKKAAGSGSSPEGSPEVPAAPAKGKRAAASGSSAGTPPPPAAAASPAAVALARSGAGASMTGNPQAAVKAANMATGITTTGDEGPRLPSLLAWLDHALLVREAEERADEGALDRLSLMTLHTAKGLEFDTVFFVGFEDGLTPYDRGGDTSGQASPDRLPTNYAEEKRLAYVGATRAKRRLYLLSTKKRAMFPGAWAKRKPVNPSRYLKSIKEHARGVVRFTDLSDQDDEGGGDSGSRGRGAGSSDDMDQTQGAWQEYRPRAAGGGSPFAARNIVSRRGGS